MGAEDDGCALLQQVLDGRQRLADPAVIGDDALVIGGDVEITAAENLFAAQICIKDGFLFVVHGEASV